MLAQTEPAPATKQGAAPNPAVMHPMVFYDAHGEANTCGPGCDEWIAADGKIEPGSADRLRLLLAQLKDTRPPIFFHSPGGLVTGSMLLGELIRARKLTVSVGHTIPLDCDGDPASQNPTSQNSCEAEIRAGHPIEAKLDFATAMCNSACVYAVAGGSIRLIPPWVTLGIHDIGIDPATAKLRHTSDEAVEFAKQTTDLRLRDYIHRMGIDDKLLTEAFATPFTSVGRLSRDDAARFGLDPREFGELPWQFADKPQPAIRKLFFVRTGDSEHHYVNAILNVACVPRRGTNAIVTLARERLASDTEIVAGQPIVSIHVGGQDIRLARVNSAKLYQRNGLLPFKALDAVSDDATIVLPGPEFGRQQGPSGDVLLDMTGFAAADAKFQKLCAEQIQQAR